MPCVLLVEDEALIRFAALDALEELGFRVKEANTVVEARAAMQMPDEVVDAVIVDVGLPDGRGDDLAAELRAADQRLPIVIASGYGEAQFRARFPNDPMMAFLDKPYEHTQLERVLARLGVKGKHASV